MEFLIIGRTYLCTILYFAILIRNTLNGKKYYVSLIEEQKNKTDDKNKNIPPDYTIRFIKGKKN